MFHRRTQKLMTLSASVPTLDQPKDNFIKSLGSSQFATLRKLGTTDIHSKFEGEY